MTNDAEITRLRAALAEAESTLSLRAAPCHIDGCQYARVVEAERERDEARERLTHSPAVQSAMAKFEIGLALRLRAEAAEAAHAEARRISALDKEECAAAQDAAITSHARCAALQREIDEALAVTECAASLKDMAACCIEGALWKDRVGKLEEALIAARKALVIFANVDPGGTHRIVVKMIDSALKGTQS